MMLFKEEAKDWARLRLEQILKEQEILQAILGENTPSLPPPEKEKKPKTPATKTENAAPTAANLLKHPDLGLKGSILMILKANKRKMLSIQEITSQILTIETDDPSYKKVAGSIRQTLRIGAKNNVWRRIETGGKTTYGV